MNKNLIFKIGIEEGINLKERLEKMGFKVSYLENAFWRAKDKNSTLTFYKNGNLLIQGKENEKILNYLLREKIIFEKFFENWIGTDEAGKGDYFGPLVVAAVAVDKKNILKILKEGIRDSKKIEDKTVEEIAQKIKNLSLYSIVIISPAKYNELINRMKNLNRLLAWGHARAIENILQKREYYYAISDKFGDEKYIKDALMKKGKKINLIQRHSGEEDIAVASASIIARDNFLKELRKMSEKYGIEFPRGATEEVIKAGLEFVKKFGRDRLGEVAKIHFRITQKILS